MPMQMSKKEIQLRQQFTEKKQQADKALQEGKQMRPVPCLMK